MYTQATEQLQAWVHTQATEQLHHGCTPKQQLQALCTKASLCNNPHLHPHRHPCSHLSCPLPPASSASGAPGATPAGQPESATLGAKPKSCMPKTPAKAMPPSKTQPVEEDTSKGNGKGGGKKLYPSTEDRTKHKWEKPVTARVVNKFRTPFAHRRGHMNPNKIFKFVRNLPAVWKTALGEEQHMKDFKAAKAKLSHWEDVHKAGNAQNLQLYSDDGNGQID